MRPTVGLRQCGVTSRVPWLGVLLAGSLVASGCNDAGVGKRAVSGSVQYANAAVEFGEMRFVPIQDTQGKITAVEIRDGRFTLPAERGLLPGIYRIEVVGYRHRDGSSGPIDLMSADANYVQYIPAKYNKSSQETVSVVQEKSPLLLELGLPK